MIGCDPDLFLWPQVDPRLPSAPHLLTNSTRQEQRWAGQEQLLGRRSTALLSWPCASPQAPVKPHLLLGVSA